MLMCSRLVFNCEPPTPPNHPATRPATPPTPPRPCASREVRVPRPLGENFPISPADPSTRYGCLAWVSPNHVGENFPI